MVKTLLLVIAGAAAAVVCAIALSAGALSRASASESREPLREIQIVARNMTFYVDGRAEANPALACDAAKTFGSCFATKTRG